MSANSLMGRYADIQHAVDGLLQTTRRLRDRSQPAPDQNLKLIEDGLFVVGHELLAIATDLKAEARAIEINNEQAIRFLEQCQELLAKHERLAEQDGLLPTIIADREDRQAPGESFSTDRFDVTVDAESCTTVVREKPQGAEAGNVVALPTGLARLIYRQGRRDECRKPGGAA
ncbi:MAG: hypothetical protein WD928_10105 [Gammaproteobacteria bacterium]